MDLAQVFLTPQNTTHRHYEALRAYFVDRMPGPEVATRFGYTPGSLHQLVHQFRCDPTRMFFIETPQPGAKTTKPPQPFGNGSSPSASRINPCTISARP